MVGTFVLDVYILLDVLSYEMNEITFDVLNKKSACRRSRLLIFDGEILRLLFSIIFLLANIKRSIKSSKGHLRDVKLKFVADMERW